MQLLDQPADTAAPCSPDAGGLDRRSIAARICRPAWRDVPSLPGVVFGDQAMTVAVVDRLVHHATIFEMNVESYRRRAALKRKRSRGRPPTHATITANA